MSQQTLELIDLSELSLRDLDELKASVIAHALHERLDSAARPGDSVATFESNVRFNGKE